ncbi:MAG TPA: hypothetical protein DDZ51_24080 [Planctomycetaceae bacterium]|nr:hypothetical protein [Planctomycetaceae bacterium]
MQSSVLAISECYKGSDTDVGLFSPRWLIVEAPSLLFLRLLSRHEGGDVEIGLSRFPESPFMLFALTAAVCSWRLTWF